MAAITRKNFHLEKGQQLHVWALTLTKTKETFDAQHHL